LLSEQERQSMFWELAVGYLEGLARDADLFRKRTRRERQRYWR
jgi:hypothetical protein